MKYTIKAPPSKTEQLITVDIPTPAAKAVVTDNPLLISVSVADPVATHTITGTTPIDPVVTPPVDPPVTPPAATEVQGFGSPAAKVIGREVVTISNSWPVLRSGVHYKFTRDVELTGSFRLEKLSNVIIDANGFDVTLKGGSGGDVLSIRGGENIFIKGIRAIGGSNDCINVIEGARKVAIVYCTAYRGADGCIDLANGNDVTIEYCLLGPSGGEGLMLVTALNASIHHNVFYPVGGKAERMAFAHANYSPGVGNPNMDFRNNVLWKHGRYATGVDYKATANVVNNYYFAAAAGSTEMSITLDPDPTAGSGSKIYARGNVSYRGTNLNDNGNLTTEIPIPDYAKIAEEDARMSARRIIPIVGTAKKTDDEKKWLSEIVIN